MIYKIRHPYANKINRHKVVYILSFSLTVCLFIKALFICGHSLKAHAHARETSIME